MNKLILCVFFTFAFIANIFSQWPGNYYAFTLKDSDGNAITSANKNFKMTAIGDSESVVGIEMCKDDQNWKFYEGGNHYMGRTFKLKIEKVVDGKIIEIMTIEFLPSISGGKDHYYRNLYAGTLVFRKGTCKIKLPRTDDKWDDLKEIKICSDQFNAVFYDVSEYQK